MELMEQVFSKLPLLYGQKAKDIMTFRNEIDDKSLDLILDAKYDKEKEIWFGLARARNVGSTGNLYWKRINNVTIVRRLLDSHIKRILLEDLAYAYGNQPSRFTEKLNQFNL